MLKNLLKLRGSSNYSLLKHSTQIKLYATEQEPQGADAIPAETKHIKRVNELLGKYNEQEAEKILNVINNYTLKELLG